jgi:RNase P protein component
VFVSNSKTSVGTATRRRRWRRWLRTSWYSRTSRGKVKIYEMVVVMDGWMDDDNYYGNIVQQKRENEKYGYEKTDWAFYLVV